MTPDPQSRIKEILTRLAGSAPGERRTVPTGWRFGEVCKALV